MHKFGFQILGGMKFFSLPQHNAFFKHLKEQGQKREEEVPTGGLCNRALVSWQQKGRPDRHHKMWMTRTGNKEVPGPTPHDVADRNGEQIGPAPLDVVDRNREQMGHLVRHHMTWSTGTGNKWDTQTGTT